MKEKRNTIPRRGGNALSGEERKRRTEMNNNARELIDIENLPPILRVEDLKGVLDIGRNSAYALVRSGQIRSVKVGRQLRVPRKAVLEFMNCTDN